MDPTLVPLVAVIGYLVGSISFARIVAAIFAPGQAIGKTVYKSVDTGAQIEVDGFNATMVSQNLGAKYGLLTALLDMLKIAIPAYALNRLYPGQPYLLISATFGMVGHIWPIYYDFKGGQGLSAVYGAMLAVDPLGVIVCGVGGLILGMFILRNIFVVFFGGVWLFIPWLWWRSGDVAYVIYAVVVNLLLVLAMLPSMRQYAEARTQTTGDINESLQSFPMGRGLYKMSMKMGLTKERSGPASGQPT
jgi:acyl phosphate:glycerol-3-phosphate acyltransferase